MGVTENYLSAAQTALALLGDSVVSASWQAPSALPKMNVRALAGHLGQQVVLMPDWLATPVPRDGERVSSLVEYYAQAEWVGADLDADINVRVRERGESIAKDGPGELVARVAATIEELRGTLAEESVERPLFLPWASRTMSLGDFLTTRMVELAVHMDDLAVSVGVPTPVLPEGVGETVLDLLSRIAVRRHGAVAVLRAFSRAERAPESISAL